MTKVHGNTQQHYHGTPRGYKQHVQRKIPTRPCSPCRKAWSMYNQGLIDYEGNKIKELSHADIREFPERPDLEAPADGDRVIHEVQTTVAPGLEWIRAEEGGDQ